MPSSSNFDLSSGLFSLQIQPQSGEPVTAVNGSSLSSSATPAASSSGVPLRKGLMWQQGGHSKLPPLALEVVVKANFPFLNVIIDIHLEFMNYLGNGSGLTLQRDRIFSRWKERYFVLTRDYLQCFKKGSSRISEMGGFIFKIRLAEVSHVCGNIISFASNERPP